jgi:hypothetical protein
MMRPLPPHLRLRLSRRPPPPARRHPASQVHGVMRQLLGHAGAGGVRLAPLANAADAAALRWRWRAGSNPRASAEAPRPPSDAPPPPPCRPWTQPGGAARRPGGDAVAAAAAAAQGRGGGGRRWEQGQGRRQKGRRRWRRWGGWRGAGAARDAAHPRHRRGRPAPLVWLRRREPLHTRVARLPRRLGPRLLLRAPPGSPRAPPGRMLTLSAPLPGAGHCGHRGGAA